MNAEVIQSLAVRVADVVETDEGICTSVQMGEMADGSRRYFALVNTVDGEFEQEYRVSTPATLRSPTWAAAKFDEWTIEVRTGDTWLTLEYA